MSNLRSNIPWLSVAFAAGIAIPLIASSQGMGRGMGRNMPTFAEYDLNGDGKIVEPEFNEARAKRISARAQQGYRMRNLDHAPSFNDLDSNGDGSISAEEFSAHQAQRVRSG
jgi:hypothetical protein